MIRPPHHVEKAVPAMNRRSRAPRRVLVRVPCCLALLSGLLLGAAGHAAADRAAAVAPAHPRAGRTGAPLRVPAPPGAGDRAGAVVTGRVTPVDAKVDRNTNGEFTLTVANTGAQPARRVRVLLDDGLDGNGVGSADGRCLSRIDTASPADLWCELGDLAPGESVTVGVHSYMFRCVWLDPYSSLPQLRAPAFFWRIAYQDAGQARVMNEPTPRWSC